MASTPTKKLKTEVKSAIKSGMAERGWEPDGDVADAYRAPDGLVEPPLSFEWSLSIDSYSHGGATVSGIGRLLCTDVADALMQFDESALDSAVLDFPDPAWRRRTLSELDAVSQGELLDPLGNYHQWIVADEESLKEMVADFFTMIDGRLGHWIGPRRSPTTFLEHYGRGDMPGGGPGPRFRPAAVLSVMLGRPDLARSLVAGYEPPAYDDSEEQVAAFERELAQRFPDYGPLQRR